MTCFRDGEDSNARVMAGLNIMVPGSKGSDGKNTEALISIKLRSEKIEMTR